MWKLKIAESSDGPYLFSTNNFVGRQIWEFDPKAGTPEERAAVEQAREDYKKSCKKGRDRALPCADLLMRMQLKRENNIDLSIPPVRLGEKEDVNYKAVTTALRKAVRLNCAIQACDGHWPAECGGAFFLTPPLASVIIILHISGTMNTILTAEHKKEIIRFIYLHQNNDGGWGFYIEGHSTMISSAPCYVALRLLGERCDDGENGPMRKARKWILDNGDATMTPSWGKICLSVLGVYEWSGCNPLPPEFWLFPSYLPYHPAKMWCFGREAYMPMSYLYGRKYHGPITDLVKSLRQEIYTKPYEQIDWNKARNECCKKDLYYPHTFIQDLLWDGLHYLSEPIINCWPFNKIRERALRKTIKHMRYGAEASRYICLASAEKVFQMMCWWAEDPNGEEFKYHLARVPDYLWLAEDGMKVQNVGSQTWDCALATQALIASNMIDECGDSLKKAHFYIKESQVKENPAGDFKSMYRHFTKGSWSFPDKDQGWAVSDCTAESLKMPPESVGDKADVGRLYDAVDVLLYLQDPKTGGFGAWEPPIREQYLQRLNPSEVFADAMVEKEHVECTASVIQALVTFRSLYPRHREKEIEIAVAKAVRFLEETQWHDGSWYGYWGICFIYGTFFGLRGLASAGKTYENNKAVRRAVQFLLSTQNEEGGWGENLESVPSMVIPILKFYIRLG
ncbi:Dammarenediol II synthase [Actinidia chinensis var. chinensis]|uniref:Terpene cyclase/mutase family member n=1 Tax=Actinidia chinensis var. chinensis TaxID=1590841 RepID=A0A2R6RG78_ACTCC|nr:Dammarenediol II synthase [Actinidia chinensis var. chinensis]